MLRNNKKLTKKKSLEEFVGRKFIFKLIDENCALIVNGPTKEELENYHISFNSDAADTTNAEYLRDDLGLKGEGLAAGVYDIDYVRNSHREFRTSNTDTTSRVSFPTDLDSFTNVRCG